MTDGTATQASTAPPSRGTAAQRWRVRLLAGGAWIVGRLPEGPLLRGADLAGRIAYRLSGRRREQARRNLRRVCEWLASNELGDPAGRRGATDPAALEALVRAAFRQHARYWIELIRAPRMSADYIRARVDIGQPEVLEASLAPGGAVIFVGMHFGAIEMPGFYLGRVARRRAVGPMETVGDPALQAWFMATRLSMGVRLVGLREARRELQAALERGDAVGLVADRDLTGGGIELPFFGHPAPLAAGPAILAVESGAPVVAVAVRRTGLGRYAARLEALDTPRDGTRRERVEGFLAAEARAFERAIAEAPEQWWAVFHPIWRDLAVAPRPVRGKR